MPEAKAITSMLLGLSYENSHDVNGFNLNLNRNFAVIGNTIAFTKGDIGIFSRIYSYIHQYEYLHKSMYDHYISDLFSRKSLDKFFMLKVNRDNSQIICDSFNSYNYKHINTRKYH